MSELKEIGIRWEENGELHFSHVYLKSEADKVIAELKNEIEEQKRLRDMALASVPNVLKVMKIIQHQKYKRCLAMARWCRTSARYDEGVGAFKYRDWYWKWFKRWSALAEEPTWAKFLQLIHKEAK